MEKRGVSRRKDPKWQIKLAIVLLFISSLIFYYLYNSLAFNLAISWVFGLLVGFTLQRAKICFTATLRDPIFFGLTELARAVILSLLIATIGYSIIQYYQMVNGLSLSGRFVALGWHIPIGALIFGVGAAISGGCASGTLVRLGEGFQLQWVALIGFLLGSVHGAHDADWWYRLFSDYEVPHLPTLIGWGPSILLQVSMLVILYLLLKLQ
ncbi:YeeE/YedE thiosulfate transporter family protein [Orenia marismortui]|uniref:YeeE/YedE thiosulfate transporter family protein n=1 Tax=Orenia marismortui TaxID=46469 RepID=UPI0003746943|nr:YeeE/YedE thiosulfate transporter family protein [Orenia marismortui]